MNNYKETVKYIESFNPIGRGLSQFTIDFCEWVCDGCEGSDLGYQVDIILDIIKIGKDRHFFLMLSGMIEVNK